MKKLRHSKSAFLSQSPSSTTHTDPQNTGAPLETHAAMFETQGVSRRSVLRFMGATVGGLGLLHTLPAGATPAVQPPAAPATAASTAAAPAASGASSWPISTMDGMTLIHTRRSQRDFTGEPVPQDVLQAILAAGMSAPSAKNSQPWEFVVMTKPASIQRIAQVQPLVAYAAKAGAAILLCVDTTKDVGEALAIISGACCGQNMLLAAHALGYGGVWIQVYPKTDVMAEWKRILKLPEEILPLAIITIGKATSPLPPINRTNPKKIHYESW